MSQKSSKVWNGKKTENLEDRIDNLLDPTYSRNLLPINLVKGDYAFSGFVGNLNLVRSRPGEQYLFLNRRGDGGFVRSEVVGLIMNVDLQMLTCGKTFS